MYTDFPFEWEENLIEYSEFEGLQILSNSNASIAMLNAHVHACVCGRSVH